MDAHIFHLPSFGFCERRCLGLVAEKLRVLSDLETNIFLLICEPLAG